MLTIKLYGALRELCDGRKAIDLDVRSPAEAIRALSVLFPRFRPWLTGPGRATPIKVAATLPGRVAFTYGEQALDLPQSKGVLRLVPMLSGASGSRAKAWGQIIVGAVLIAASYFDFGLTANQGAMLFSSGVAMMLGGASQLIAMHLAPDPTQQNSVNNQPSYAFNGVVNTTGQGGPVPLCYGRLRIGSQVLSAGFSSNNEVLV